MLGSSSSSSSSNLEKVEGAWAVRQLFAAKRRLIRAEATAVKENRAEGLRKESDDEKGA